jgi:hypothetical protein
MPSGSPQSPDEASIEALYRDLGVLFGLAARHGEGMTLTEFAQRWSAGSGLQPHRAPGVQPLPRQGGGQEDPRLAPMSRPRITRVTPP